MPWNGSGTYSPPSASFPEVNGNLVDAVRYNAVINDLAAGVQASLAKNGENTPTQNLPMGGKKHTGAASGAAAGEYLVYAQVSARLGTLEVNSGSTAQHGGYDTTNAGGGFLSYAQGGASYGFVGNAKALFSGVGGLTDFGIRAETQMQFGIGLTTIALLNSNGFVVTRPGSAGLASLSGSLTSFGEVGVGRTAVENILAAVGVANQFLTGTVPGDGVCAATVGKFWVGTTSSQELAFGTNGVEVAGFDTSGRFYSLPTKVHNNASGLQGATRGLVGSGTYTPTLTNVVNIPSAAVVKAHYVRLGMTVIATVHLTTGALTASSNTVTTLGISIPVGAVISAGGDVPAVVMPGLGGIVNASYSVSASNANQRIEISWVSNGSTASHNLVVMFMYEVK